MKKLHCRATDLPNMEGLCGYDVETLGSDNIMEDDLAVMQIYYPVTDTSYVVDARDLTEEDTQIMKNIFSRISVVGHWLQFDLMKSFNRFKMIPKVGGDTYLLACMLQWENKGLKSIARNYVPECNVRDIETVVNPMYPIQWDLTDENQLEYCALDPYLSWKIQDIMVKNGTLQKLANPYEIECQALYSFVYARQRGLKVDTDKYIDLMKELAVKVEQETQEFHRLAGSPVKPGSAKAIQKLLYEDLSLPEPPVRTKTGAPGTSEEALQYIVGAHPCVEALLRVKHSISVKSGSEKLPMFLDDDDRVHPEVLQLGQDGTSRVYTTKPSTNQYPRELRDCIVPTPGYKFFYFDWSAAELILCAYWSKCQELLDAYREGDIHKYVASRILGKEDVTPEERSKVKVVVFSTLFGSEGDAAARRLMISRDEAYGYVRDFYRVFHEIDELRAKTVEYCHRTLYTRTIFGRPRKLEDINSSSSYKSEHAERQAFNTSIQGSVADCMKIAVAKSVKYLDKDVHFVQGVFDSLLFEVPESMSDDELVAIANDLSSFKGLKFNFKWATGHTWKEVQDKT